MKSDDQSVQDFLDRVEKHQGILIKIASVYAKGAIENQDLVQDMLVQLWQAFPTFQGQSAFSTWMYRVALNTALMHQRQSKRRPEHYSDHLSTLEPSGVDDEQEDEDIHILKESIRQLPSLDRAIILLYLEGYRYEEIAEITGLSPKNISVKIVRIKTKLKSLLIAKGVQV